MAQRTEALTGVRMREYLAFCAHFWPNERSRWESMMNAKAVVAVKPVLRRASRTEEQNRLYQPWLSIIAHEMGEPRRAVEHWLKLEFLPFEEYRGERIPAETSSLTVPQMKDFLDSIDRFAQEQMDIQLPQTRAEFEAWYAERGRYKGPR